MIPLILVLALLSLLVATDPEPTGSSIPPTPEPPLRPDRPVEKKADQEDERLAA